MTIFRQRLIYLALFMIFALSACVQKNELNNNTVVVDASLIFQKCEACVKAQTHLDNMNKQMQGEFEQMQKSMEKMQNEVITMQADLQKGKKNKKQVKQKDIDDAVKKMNEAKSTFQAKLGEFQNELKTTQQNMGQKLTDTFKEVMKQYREENGIAIIVNKNNVLDFDPQKDVTEELLAALNAKKIDLNIPADETNSKAPEDLQNSKMTDETQQ